MVFKSAMYGNDKVIRYILTQPNKYPFLINSSDEEGHTLAHFYNHSPNMQKFLFEHGLVPRRKQERGTELQNILQDGQSVHSEAAVKKTSFITQNLVKSIKANSDELEQAVTSYMGDIPKLLTLYQNDQVRLGLLSRPETEKRSVMKKTLPDNQLVPDDREFLKIVINEAKQALETQYLRKGQNGKYDEGYPTAPQQYDYARDDAKVTIPESIGYVKLFIDKFTIPLEERKELLVTLAEKNPQLVEEKLSQIGLELGNNGVSSEQITNRTKFYNLLNDVDDDKINKLFKEISDLNIEEIWREQKEIVLLEQIYVAATAYGTDSACIYGTYHHIINSVSEIDSKLMDQYAEHLDKESEQEQQKDTITEKNITRFVKGLAEKLIQYVEDNPELKKCCNIIYYLWN